MNCALCGEQGVIAGKACSYCGYISVEYLNKTAEEEGQRRMEEYRGKRLSGIDEIGFIAVEMDFGGDHFETGNMTKHTIALLDKDGVKSSGARGHNVPVAAGRSVRLYKKAAGKTAQFDANIVIPAEMRQFLLGAKINEHLKLNLYCRPDASSEWLPEPVAKDIKLGGSFAEA